MGNETPKIQKQPNPTEDISISHERFERCKYINSSDLLEITIDVPEEKQMKLWETDVTNSINSFENKDSLLLPIRHEYQPKGWCGTIGSAKIYYENFPYLFSEEIDNRISMSKYFEEEEIWYLLNSLVGCAKDFSTLDMKIGDVRPHNIFINEEGQIKIANAFSWPYEKTNFEKSAFEKQLTYISPEEMSLLEKGNLQNTTNKFLSESFSIGLTVLESGLLCNIKELYSIENRGIDLNKLKARLNQWLNLQFTSGESNQLTGYSNLLKIVVTALCQIDPQNRASSLEIEEILRPYQNQIMNLRGFDRQNIEFNLPQSLRRGQQQPQRPAEQVYNSQQVKSIPQQQVYAIPSQSYRVVAAEPRAQVNYGPTQVIRQSHYQEPIKVSQANFNSAPIGIPIQQGNREIFNQYSVNQPPLIKNQVFQHQQQQQQFYKYPLVQHSQVQPYQPSQAFSQAFFTPQTNAYNIPPVNIGTSQFSSNSQYISSAQQSQFVGSQVPQFTNAQQFVPVSSNANDFLKKIDQQLESSRKYYPS